MGEFHDAVSTLLDAFTHGMAVIKTQRGRRKKESIPIDSTTKSAETNLSKALKKNRVDVKDAYGKDLARHGPDFAKGDAEAHSSLTAILFRLNAAFVSVIERFTRGHSTPNDYQALLNLSNASRMEAIDTFSQLSQRLSRSSLALVPISPSKQARETHRRGPKKSLTSSVERQKHSRSKSAPELSVTREGWVRRPKSGRKHSSDSNKSSSVTTSSRSSSSTPKRSLPKPRSPPPLLPAPISTIHENSPTPPQVRKGITAAPLPPPYRSPTNHRHLPELPAPIPQELTSHHYPVPAAPLILRNNTNPTNRKSIMSFASDSTKLGEIPEHKWARPGMFEDGNFPITTFYPLELYQEPEKPKSRLRRLFRR